MNASIKIMWVFIAIIILGSFVFLMVELIPELAEVFTNIIIWGNGG